MSADADVLVVGSGPAGLAAAEALRRLGVPRVLVIDREPELGGIPRHCVHTGFGWLDLRRVLSGPAYARRRTERARQAGVETLVETSATGWAAPSTLTVTAPSGVRTLSARALLLATGCRERPRAARLVPGSRPPGLFTTGSLQQMVYFQRQRVGRRAVVVGAEHVSFSAVHTLAGSGTEVAAMVTDLPAHQSYAMFRLLTATRHGVPIVTGARVTEIIGRRRVEGVEITELASGLRRRIDCDTVVFTGDWIPDHELARAGRLEIDDGTRGPRVDARLRSSVPGVFAAGNLLHAAEIADVAALDGRAVAAAIAAYLDDGEWPAARIPIAVEPPLDWIFPNAIAPGSGLPPRGRFILRARAFVHGARLEVSQDGRLLHHERVRRMVPNQPVHLASRWLGSVAAGGGPIVVAARLPAPDPRRALTP